MSEKTKGLDDQNYKANPGEDTLQITPEVGATIQALPDKNPEAFKKIYTDAGNIRILPFVDGNNENMGLENYNMVVFPGTGQTEDLAAIEFNGVTRYITGLNEFAPEVRNIADKEQRDAVIYNIRCIVADLEKRLATNVIEPEDPEFWNKVQLLSPNNKDFWSKITITCGNEPLPLNPEKDPYDLIKLMAIEAGGFSIIAKSYEDAKTKSVTPKFYLEKAIHRASVKTGGKRVINRAKGKLEDLFNHNPKILFYLAKILDTSAFSYKHKTPVGVLYNALDEYIEGEGTERDTVKASQRFIDTAKEDMETLILRSLVIDGSYLNHVIPKASGMLYHNSSSSQMGRNVNDVVEFLRNPLNEDVFKALMNEVEVYWKS